MASTFAFVAAAAVFALTYVLISLRQVARFPLERSASALLGGSLMLALGVLGPQEALASIHVDLLMLLVGMMLLASGLDVCGFFDVVSARIIGRARDQGAFIVWIMVAAAVLSALVLNDTMALLLTPIVVRSTLALRVPPIPYLVALAIAVNVGSVATEVGNPQNAYIAIRSGIPFLEFSAVMVPITAACLVVSIVIVRLAFRRELATPITAPPPASPIRVQRNGLALTLGTTVGVVSGFFVMSPEWLPFLALLGGAFVLFFVPFVSSATPRGILAKLDWGVIVLFIGLFILLGAVRASGLSDAIQAGVATLLGGGAGLVPLTGLSALLSNLISNVPAVLVLSEVVEASGGSTASWLALAASSTLAGNATILGAAANVIVVQIAARDGVVVSMKDFVKAGLPVTAATLLVSTVLLSLLG